MTADDFRPMYNTCQYSVIPYHNIFMNQFRLDTVMPFKKDVVSPSFVGSPKETG